jgi:hypothetical protein
MNHNIKTLIRIVNFLFLISFMQLLSHRKKIAICIAPFLPAGAACGEKIAFSMLKSVRQTAFPARRQGAAQSEKRAHRAVVAGLFRVQLARSARSNLVQRNYLIPARQFVVAKVQLMYFSSPMVNFQSEIRFLPSNPEYRAGKFPIFTGFASDRLYIANTPILSPR